MKGFVPTPAETVDLMVAKLFERRRPQPEETILDPGCGDGAFIEGIIRWCLTQHIPLPHITAVDSDPRRVLEARRKFRAAPTIEIRYEDFLTKPTRSRYDFIICNPPYVAITGLSENERATYREQYRTARGRFDLYLLFFEKAVSLLLPMGRLVFITPEKFLYVATAQPLRRLLAQLQVQSIQLVKEDTFGELVTYPTITTVLNANGLQRTVAILRNGVTRRVILPSDGSSWWPVIHGQDHRDNGQGPVTLQDLCLRISCGVATGADGVFIRPTNELTRALRSFAYPTIAGRQLLRGARLLPPSTHSLLVPYSPDGELLPEANLDGLKVYLEEPDNKRKLLQRTCVQSKPWYAFHETPPLPQILRPKILCKDITPHAFFWVDRSGHLVPRHSVYYVVPNNSGHLDALCSYLNSDTVARWLKANCQRAANGFLRLQSHVLKKIPIPDSLLRSLHWPDNARPPHLGAGTKHEVA